MLRPKKPQTTPSIDTTQSFRQSFLSSLSKLSNNSTLKTGFDEIRELLTNHMRDNERLGIVLNSLSEIHQQHQKPSTRKEYIKVYGLIAEIYEDKILEIFPKITMSLNKRLKEGDNQLNQAISETMGQLIEHIFKHIDPQEALKPLSAALFLFFENFQHDQKNTQIGSAMCISRIIQTSPVNCLEFLMSKILAKVREAFLSGYCKSQTQLLESLLSLILGVEEKFQDHLDEILPMVLDAMLNTDWNVRKIANDIIYTLCVLLPEGVIAHKEEIVKHLNSCRFDKIKNVRDAAAMAINIVKDIKGIDWEDRTEYNNYMPEGEDDEAFNEHPDIKEMPMNISANIKNSFSKENILEKRLGSSKKKAGKKAISILNRPINPEFLKNAVNKSDGIEIKTNQPLLPLNQNSASKRNLYEKDYHTDREEIPVNNFLESKKKNTDKISPQTRNYNVSTDVEYVQKIIKTSPNRTRSPENSQKIINNNNNSMQNLNSKEFVEVMEKMNQIIAQQNLLFEKYNYIEGDLKSQLKSTISRVELLENVINNSMRPAMNDPRSPPPSYYMNYHQVPYSQIPISNANLTTLNNLNMPIENGMYLNKPTNYVSFGAKERNIPQPQHQIGNERNIGAIGFNEKLSNNERNIGPNMGNNDRNMGGMNINEKVAVPNNLKMERNNLDYERTNFGLIDNKMGEKYERTTLTNERPQNLMNEYYNEKPSNEKQLFTNLNETNNRRNFEFQEKPTLLPEKPGFSQNNDKKFFMSEKPISLHEKIENKPNYGNEPKTNNNYDFLSRNKVLTEEKFGGNYNGGENNFLNNQPMKLETIMSNNNNNYQTFSPSKLAAELGYKEESKNFETFQQRTPPKH